MSHRGPDGVGLWTSPDGKVHFGHVRLAIVDLSPLGAQPMSSPDHRVTITYNGEIYNHLELRSELEARGHVFKSSSDTEVILAAYREWGLEFLDRIEGMFALALYDADQGHLLLARDRAGEKPLFYTLTGQELRFSSELKGLFADAAMPRKINREAMDCFLAFGYAPGELCIVDGVRKLPAGTALLFDLVSGASRTWAYWTAPVFQETGEDDQSRVDRLEHLLEDAVRRQMVADVPVGLLLSGGVDSSLITALAARSSGRVRTYTVGFTQFGDFDETPHAERVARHFGTDHTVLEADEVKPDLLARLARQYDEPIIDSSMIPTLLVSEQIRRHCAVALGGDGGDELFGGYHSASMVARLEAQLSGVPLWPRQQAAKLASLLPPGMKGRARLKMWGSDITHGLPPLAYHFDLPLRRRLLAAYGDWPFIAETVRAQRTPNGADVVQRMTRYDFANYMAEDILVKVDRAAMLNSLEVRSPFLDRRVIDFAFGSVPSRQKANPAARKIILRQLAERVLPPDFDRTRKQGFGIPLNHWLKQGPWRELFEDVLYDPSCSFSRVEVGKLFRGLDAGRPVKELLFGLALFELWRREYGAVL
jgi:asparagine synthase (glutamine-hydrolysing)